MSRVRELVLLALGASLSLLLALAMRRSTVPAHPVDTLAAWG